MQPKVTSCELAQSAQVDGFVAVLEQASERIELRRHNRLSRSLVSSETFVQVRDGVLALEAVPAGGRRQILDFLMPGDAIPAFVGVTSPGFFLRALTNATLERRSSAATDGTSHFSPEATTLLGEVWSHLMRRNLHQIMIGQLDTLSRVSSFLLMLALRRCRTLRSNLLLPLPMSRDDVADYLAMNPDTLSRIMVRLEALRIIRRLNRHSVELIDDQKLAQLSPIRPLLFNTLGSSTPGEAPRNCAPAVSGAPFPPGPPPLFGAERLIDMPTRAPRLGRRSAWPSLSGNEAAVPGASVGAPSDERLGKVEAPGEAEPENA